MYEEDGQENGHWVECGYERMYRELMSTPREKAHAVEVMYYRRKIRELEAEVARRMVPQSSAVLDAFARASNRDGAASILTEQQVEDFLDWAWGPDGHS